MSKGLITFRKRFLRRYRGLSCKQNNKARSTTSLARGEMLQEDDGGDLKSEMEREVWSLTKGTAASSKVTTARKKSPAGTITTLLMRINHERM